MKLHTRYRSVRTIRERRKSGRPLNREDRNRGESEDDALPSFADDDERWLRNFNTHNLDRGVNISCSFNPKTDICYMCLGKPHRALTSKGDGPVVIVLSDQGFLANVPAVDGGECLRVYGWKTEQWVSL